MSDISSAPHLSAIARKRCQSMTREVKAMCAKFPVYV